MDAAMVRAMLEQHFSSGDPDLRHAMYHEDAVLEFPQSGERFVGVENFREWRSNYPASTTVEFREIRGRDDLWVAELTIRYDEGPGNPGISILEFRGDKIAREPRRLLGEAARLQVAAASTRSREHRPRRDRRAAHDR